MQNGKARHSSSARERERESAKWKGQTVEFSKSERERKRRQKRAIRECGGIVVLSRRLRSYGGVCEDF